MKRFSALVLTALLLAAPVASSETPSSSGAGWFESFGHDDVPFTLDGPFRLRRQDIERLVDLDARFAVAINRQAAVELAAIYSVDGKIDPGRSMFEGTIAEYGYWLAILRLYSPVYGRDSMIHPDHNPEAWTLYPDYWRKLDDETEAAGLAPGACPERSRFTGRSLEEVSLDLYLMANSLAAYSANHAWARHLFMPAGQAGDEPTYYSRETLVAAASRWLLDADPGGPYSPDCPFDGTNLAKWMDLLLSPPDPPFPASASPDEQSSGGRSGPPPRRKHAHDISFDHRCAACACRGRPASLGPAA